MDMGKKLECVTDRHNAMSMAEREAELMAAIGRLPGGLSLPKTRYFRLYIDLRLQAEQGDRCYLRRR
jgi:hypothetical protein